VPGVVILLL